MRERRRKRKLAQNVEDNDDSSMSNGVSATNAELKVISREVGNDLSSTEDGKKNNKRSHEKIDDEVGDSSSADPPSKKTKRRLDLETKVINGKLYVVVPNKIPTKDAKKFRKDARRTLREDEKDVSNLVFVDEDELPPAFRSTKQTKHFPSIKDLIQQKKKERMTNKEEERKKEKIHQIPVDIKNKYVALDCEMVGIGTDGKKSALARVSIVDWDLNVVLDTFVKVPIRVTDFRTHVSGVEPKHIKDKKAMGVDECRNRVAEILNDKILVGHALTNDFKALMLNHPKSSIRDTAKYRPFQRFGNGKWRPRKLRDLVKENLKGKEGFQEAEHDSVEDARSTMELFQVVWTQWEKELSSKK